MENRIESSKQVKLFLLKMMIDKTVEYITVLLQQGRLGLTERYC
jgi:hypothetical protein